MNTDNKWTELTEYFERQEKEVQDYKNWNDETRQDLWTRYIFQLLQSHRWSSQTHSPEMIIFSNFRKNNKFWEENPDKYLPWVVDSLYWLYDENVLEDIFILDEQAKKYLATHSSLSSHSKQVENIVNWSSVKKNKTSSIEWVDLSSEELAERVWNLFYDSLTWFISLLWHEIKEWNKELSQVWEYLKKASFNIYNAWTICLPYVWEWFPNLKHSHDIKWVEISREELVERIANLTDDLLKKFLLDLSKKIHKDWLADEWRWRKKLSTELFEASKNIELAWNSL